MLEACFIATYHKVAQTTEQMVVLHGELQALGVSEEMKAEGTNALDQNAALAAPRSLTGQKQSSSLSPPTPPQPKSTNLNSTYTVGSAPVMLALEAPEYVEMLYAHTSQLETLNCLRPHWPGPRPRTGAPTRGPRGRL